MIYLLFTLLFSKLALIGAGSVGALGLGAAMLGLVPRPWGLLAKVGGVVLVLHVAAGVGFRLADERCEAKALRDQVAALTRDLAVQKQAAQHAAAARAKAQAYDAALEQKVDDYEADLAGRSPAACRATADDIRRLLSIK